MLAFLRAVPIIAGMNITVATLPSGDVERVLFFDVEGGVRAVVEHTITEADVTQRKEQILKKGRYSWHLDEEHRSVLMALPGHPTGVVRQAWVLSGWADSTPDPGVAPHPVEVFRFYAPSREAAQAMKDRLKKSLSR